MLARLDLRVFLIVVVAFGSLRLDAGSPVYPTVEYLRTVPSVKEFTKPRGVLSKLVTFIAGPDDSKADLLRPYAITQDSTGRLLIADPGDHGIHIYDFEKRKYQFLKGPHGKELESPMGVVCDLNNDDIYVSDSVRRQIYVFDKRGRLLRMIGGRDSEGRLERPTGIAIDNAARRIYVTDSLRHQLMVFGMDGSLIHAIGKQGHGSAEFNFPTAVTVSSGKVYVVDAMNFRIQTFSPDGQFLNAFGQLGDQTGTLNRPKGIAADTDGNLYIVDALFETVQVFDSNGRLLYYFGSTGSSAGQFLLPAGISIDNRNTIYIADSMNQRIQVFRRRIGG
jgi:DNA-binding beta-propeller fold protein YncE